MLDKKVGPLPIYGYGIVGIIGFVALKEVPSYLANRAAKKQYAATAAVVANEPVASASDIPTPKSRVVGGTSSPVTGVEDNKDEVSWTTLQTLNGG